MNESKETQRVVIGIYSIAAVLALSIGLGFLIGPGAGWLFFGAFLLLAAVTAVKSAKQAQP